MSNNSNLNGGPAINILRLDAAADGFYEQLDTLVAWSAVSDIELESSVKAIMLDVRTRGDDALLDYTRQFDGFSCKTIEDLRISQSAMHDALNSIDKDLRLALELSMQRIEDFHNRQLQQSWRYTDATGTMLGQQVTALERVGIYVPGGKAAYPSSVLMNAVPANVAGVEEVIMVSPAPAGELNQTVLAAAALAGVDHFFAVGGAQAIAALAYGTQSVPRFR